MEKETITYEEILKRLEHRIQSMATAIKLKNNRLLRDLCVCSILSGDEIIVPFESYPVLNDSFEFTYKGHKFELSDCIANDKHTDRYVCWMQGKKNEDGQTLEEYLEANPNESAEDNCWVGAMYLVPDAWSWGSEFDLIPGNPVSDGILGYIDKFLEQNGGL